MPYIGEVRSALIATLLADTGSPDGLMNDFPNVYYDFGAPGQTKYLVVKLMANTTERVFDGIAYELPIYLVKAVARIGSGADVKAAGERIDVLLNGANGEGGTFSVSGYGSVFTQREDENGLVDYDEDDPSDAKVRWQHRGILCNVFVSPGLGSP